MADLEQVQGKVKITSDTKGADEAKDALGGFGGALQRIGEIAAGVGLERVAEKIIDISKAAVEFAVDTSSKFEQWNMGFTTMLGSADKAAKLMNQISDFAVKTPFELPQLVEGSKQLIAFGVSADDVVTRLGQLGDIAAGVGTDKMPLLIHAFGQVEAGSRLTGRELNEFVMSGVPIMQALADHYNKVGGASNAATTTIVKGTKMSADAMQSMNNKIQDTQMHLKELALQHPKTAAAQLSHDDAVAKATRNLEQYQAKLAGANKTVTSFGKAHEITAMDVKKMVENNEVSAKDVETVLGEMTSKGGRFFDMMDQQAKTFGGIVSNIHDQFSRFALAVMGFDMKEGSKTFGQLQKGTLFDQIKDGAQSLLTFLNNNQGQIVNGFKAVATAVQGIYEVSLKLWGHIVTAFTPVIKELTNVYMKHKEQIDLIAQAAGVLLYGALVALINVVAFIIQGFIGWTDVLLNRFGPGLKMVSEVIVAVGNSWNEIVKSMKMGFILFVNDVIGAINKLIDAINMIPNVHLGKIKPMSLDEFATAPTPGSAGFIGPVKPAYAAPAPNSVSSPSVMNPNNPINIYQTNNITNPNPGAQVLGNLNFALSTLR